MLNYTKRATDSLDLIVVVDVYLDRIKKTCKASVVHAAQRHIERLKFAKDQLEMTLEKLSSSKISGIKGWINRVKKANHIKSQLITINHQMVNWINSVYRYFFTHQVK